jgi:hypothetical protein
MSVTGSAPSANKAEWTTLSASQNGIGPIREAGIDESAVKAATQAIKATQGAAARIVNMEEFQGKRHSLARDWP